MNARNCLCSAILGLLICTTPQFTAATQPGSQPWDQEIQAFEAADRANPPPQDAHLTKTSAEERVERPESADGDSFPRLVPIPADRVSERRVHAQPTVPAGAKEILYVETTAEPTLTDEERQRGYLLFARPTVEPVYPNSRSRPDERLNTLVAFAAPGQFEPVTMTLFPVRPLVNLKVRVSPLASSAGEIPADRIDVRLGTYWNVGYPSYTTVNTYRRTPELLERVTVHSSPAGECQRYWLLHPCSRRRQAGPLSGNGDRVGRWVRPSPEHPDRSAGPRLPPAERPGQALLGLFLHAEQDSLPRAERGLHSQGRR